MGKEYPAGADFFHKRLKAAFQKHTRETDPQKIEELLKRGEYIIREIEALYMLKKYRTLKKFYYDSATSKHPKIRH